MKPEECRSVDELVACFKSGAKAKYVYFWGHTPPKTGVNQSCFSQWFGARFTEGDNSFGTAEHYMMYRKARLFEDQEAAERILTAKSPGAAKALGREVRGFKDEVWKANRFEIVAEGNYLKFSQNDEMREYLLNTRNRVLVEASPVDRIWGVGLDKDNDRIKDPQRWNGLNLLGFALMEARARLLK